MGKIGGDRLKAFTLIFLNDALTRAVSWLTPSQRHSLGSAVLNRAAQRPKRLYGGSERKAEYG
jgi:hypothetical protein